MYAFTEMIDLGFRADAKPNWTSDDHKQVAINALIGNPAINNRDALIESVKLINDIPKDSIRTVTVTDLIKIGIPFHFN